MSLVAQLLWDYRNRFAVKQDFLWVLKYDPNQPRDKGGRWTGGYGDLLSAISKPDGGFSYSPTTRTSPKSGYMLSIYKPRELVLDVKQVTGVILAKYVRKNRDLLKDPKNYLGVWHNPENSKVYIDISRRTTSRREAVHLGNQHDQEAYFDLTAGKSVPLKAKKHEQETITPPDRRTDSRGSGQADQGTHREGSVSAGNRGDEEDPVRTYVEILKYDPDQPRDTQGRFASNFGRTRYSHPAVSLERAKKLGYTEGPYYHSTDHARAIERQGARSLGAEPWELEEPGEMEDFRKWGTANPIMFSNKLEDVIEVERFPPVEDPRWDTVHTVEEMVARGYRLDREAYGKDVITFYAKPGTVKDASRMTLAGGLYVSDPQHIIPIKGSIRPARKKKLQPVAQKYDPSQARDPKGTSTGGQFAAGTGRDANGLNPNTGQRVETGGHWRENEKGERPYHGVHKWMDPTYEPPKVQHKLLRGAYIGMWGGSHSGSYAITGASAVQMGIEGYEDKGASDEATALAARMVQAIAEDTVGSEEVLQHVFENVQHTEFKVGDTLQLPLTATSGDLGTSYGIRGDADNQRGQPVVFEFEKGTQMVGYSITQERDVEDIGQSVDAQFREQGYLWNEAIVAGAFEVVGVQEDVYMGSQHFNEFYRKPENAGKTIQIYGKVVRLRQVKTFDPKTKTWVPRG